MKIDSDLKILIAATAGIVACIGDFLFLLILGRYYPGYNQLKNTMSSLGASVSPVSNIISTWWIILGVLFIIFGFGVKEAFVDHGRIALIASWAIIIYGIGEGIGSGAFKANHIGNSLTQSAYIHDFLGAIGIIAILALPLIMRNIIPETGKFRFNLFSWIIFWISLITLILFTFRFTNNQHTFVYIYKGLWQRIFMFAIYCYLLVIAIYMLKKKVPIRS